MIVWYLIGNYWLKIHRGFWIYKSWRDCVMKFNFLVCYLTSCLSNCQNAYTSHRLVGTKKPYSRSAKEIEAQNLTPSCLHNTSCKSFQSIKFIFPHFSWQLINAINDAKVTRSTTPPLQIFLKSRIFNIGCIAIEIIFRLNFAMAPTQPRSIGDQIVLSNIVFFILVVIWYWWRWSNGL